MFSRAETQHQRCCLGFSFGAGPSSLGIYPLVDPNLPWFMQPKVLLRAAVPLARNT